ncbi:hypothetical protein [Methylobacterium sp. 275MFSha3.1]|uniref:hypothetical protein n=1 Tax=Methylobacterium sp. 275MFSha3.1 TaxID=1502746 RepID=UPI001115399B|nr:hypothetical protein [Methylobacterium sp. 275MFSha3.1]
MQQFLDVITGRADWLRFEGVTDEYLGFEFAVCHNRVVSWHQTKLSSPNGNWTISALSREGLIKAFGDRLRHEEHNECFFVSQDPAKDLGVLTEKARIANTADELELLLSKDHRDVLKQLSDTWSIESQIAFQWLRRIFVKNVPVSVIDETIEAKSALCFADESSTVFPKLRDVLEKNFNKVLTTDSAREIVRQDCQLTIKDWSLDPSLREKLRAETKSYLETYSPYGAGGRDILRPQVAEIMKILTQSDGPMITLVTGVAGAGKSGVVRGVIRELEEHRVTHLALRVDHHLDCSTREAIGRAVTGRSESPAATLKGLEPSGRSVLIVDQLDAVSEISGRNGVVKDAVLRMVADVRAYRSVRIMLVCRTFDLESDRRLKEMRNTPDLTIIDTPLLDWSSEVEPFLKSKDVDIGRISSPQRELLRLPLNLAMFIDVPPGFGSGFRSRDDLFRYLIEHKERAVRARKASWSLFHPLSALADWMSDRQRLEAPVSLLDTFGGAQDLLRSEHLIVISRGRVNFFHESFFDYIYARAFSSKHCSVVDLLNSTEQHLFRRTQVRQILETLRQSDYPRYLSELKNLMDSTAVRYHIKVAVAQWLGTQRDPSPAERDIVLRIDTGSEELPALLRYAALQNAGWFDVLVAIGWVEVNLASGDARRRPILWWLASIAGERPAQISSILERWWDGDEERGNALLDWFATFLRTDPTPCLLDLCERVIRSAPSQLFEKRTPFGRHFLINVFAGEHAARSAKVLQAHFDAWFHTHPGLHPFERLELRELDTYALGEIAKRAPFAFLEGTTRALDFSVDLVLKNQEAGEWDTTFNHRTLSGNRFGADEFIGFYRDALIEVAKSEPERAVHVLSSLDATKHEVFMHLHLEAIAANGLALGAELPALLRCGHLFEAGYDGADWLSFARAASAALEHLQPPEVLRIEETILSHFPEIEQASRFLRANREGDGVQIWKPITILHYLGRSGFEQFCVLKTIGDQRLSAAACRRLQMFCRKFGANARLIRDEEGGFVPSPIARGSTERMTDSQWLGAIARYRSNDHRNEGRPLYDGGARQLASELQHAAKNDPARFVSLLRVFPREANPAYVQGVLWGLAESDSADVKTVAEAIRLAHSRSHRNFGSEIARLCSEFPRVACYDGVLETLFWYIEFGDANDVELVEQKSTEREVVRIEDLLERSGKLHVRGVNGVRGWAAEALGKVLWQVPEVSHKAWPVIERRIAAEELVSVRCCLVTPLAALYNDDRTRCASSVDELARRRGPTGEHKAEGALERMVAAAALPTAKIPAFLHCLGIICVQMVLRRKAKSASGSTSIDISKKSAHLSPLVTYQGTRLLPYIIHNVPGVGERLLVRLLLSKDDMMRLVAAWHIFRGSFHDCRYVRLADYLIEQSSVHRRIAASVAAGAVTRDEFQHRAKRQLIAFFNDPDGDVRKQSAEVFRQLEGSEMALHMDLAEAYVDSAAFEEAAFSFYHVLEDACCDVAMLLVKAAERSLVRLAVDAKTLQRPQRDMNQLLDLIKREYATSDHSSILRKRLLDIVDEMLRYEVYGVEAVVAAHER